MRTGGIMDFLKKLLGISESQENFIGLTSFHDNSDEMFDKKPEKKKRTKKEPSLTELLKRAN